MEFGFDDGASEIAEQTDDRPGGFDAVKWDASAKNDLRQAATVGVELPAAAVIEIGEETCRVRVITLAPAWTGVCCARKAP